MAPAAVEVRSPITSAQPTPSSSVPQNPSSDYPFTFGAIASSNLSEDQGSSSSSSFDAATKCDRGSGFTTNVPRTGSRVRPRLVKMRRQLGSPQARSRSLANEVVSGSNLMGPDSTRVGDGASTSNGVSESSDVVRNGSSACKGFSFSIGDAKSVKFESVGFVFGANRSAFDANLGSVVGGAGESVGNSGSGDRGTVKVESGRESGKIENLGFVFGAKQSGFASNSFEEKRLSGENVGKSVVGDEGNVEAESELEHGKFDDLGFMFGAGQSNMASNSNTEKREYGERVDKLCSEDAGKMKVETETEFGKHDNVGYVFGVSQSNLPSNLNLGKGGSGGNSEKPDHDGDKMNMETETVTEKCADQSELGSTSISRKRECSRNVSMLDSENGGMLKAGNEAEFGKHVDMGFVFGSSWFNSVSKNFEKRESAQIFGKLDTEDGVKVKVESGVESGKVKATVVNFDSDGDRCLNNNCEKEVFVFGSGSKEKSSFNEDMAPKCASENELNGKNFGNCKSIETQIGDLGSDVEGRGKSVFGSTCNVASFSSTSPLFELPDEMRKMKIDDSENVDGTHKTENLGKNSSANHGAASIFERSEKASGSFNRSSATGASIGISSSKEFAFQAGLSKDFDMGQFPQCQINDDTQWNASAAPSSFSSIGLECQPNGSVSEIPFIGGLENKDGNCFTSIPDGPGVSFTAFSQPKWDPSCFKGNLFPEVNKKVEFAAKGRSIKDRRLKKMRGKLKPASLSKQNLGQDHVLKEFSSQENPDSLGCYSPMDFSPYQETAAANPYTREASVTSEEFSYLDTDFAPSAPHSTVLKDAKDEDLAAAEGLDINTSGQKAREQNKEKFCNHDGRSFVCDCPSKGFVSGAETTCSSSKTEKFCSSGGAGVTSTEVRSDFTSNMEGQENNCGTQFHFASSLEDMKEKFFIFSSSSSAQGSLSATKRQHRKKSKVGRHSSVITQASSVQLSPLTSTSSQFNSVDKSEAHEQFKHGHVTFSAAMQEICEKFRLRGNQAYDNRELSKAENLYTQGINSVPSRERSGCCLKPLLLCYSNRAATRMYLGRIREALGDCEMAIALDPSFLKVQMRAANGHLVLGEVEDALQCFNTCLESGPGVCLDRKFIIEAADGLQKAQKVAEYTNRSAKLLEQRTSDAALSALEIIAEALSISLYSEKLLEMKVEALFLLRKYEEAIQLCEQSLPFAEKNFASPSTVNVDGSGCESYSAVRLWRCYLISKCYFHLGKLEAALDLLQKLEQVGSCKDKYGFKNLELSISLAVTIRELLRCKKAGNEAFQSRKYTEAVEHYTIALSSNVESRPFAAICLCNRAAAHQALGQTADAIADCSLAIALDGNYAKAVSRRATLHEMIRDYRQAASDLQRLLSLLENQSSEKAKQSGTPGSSIRELRQAQRRLPSMEEEAKKEIPLDFYLILGIKPSDTASDIKKAYRKAALKHHPDKAGQFLARSESGDEGQLWKQISQEVNKDADRLFKMIGEAYAILSDPTKRSEYDLEEDMRKAPKESHRSGHYRRTSDSHSSPFQRSTNRRNWQENWKAYGNSNFRW